MNRRNIISLVFIMSIPALANTGIPMAAAIIVTMILLFIPIVAIESWIVSRITKVHFFKNYMQLRYGEVS